MVQNNKLGITDFNELKRLEDILVKTKISILNYEITFNMTSLDLDYLKELHIFLFQDLYYEENLKIRDVYSEYQLDYINERLKYLNSLAINERVDSAYLEYLSRTFEELWEYQLFCDGNYRTLWAYLKIYIDAYKLPINLGDIIEESKHLQMFKLTLRTKEKMLKLSNSKVDI
ncbi:MAG: hypothetical protein IJ509_01555 [Bacilli bacterium]|nr:hypothetical protein [Bacilli bacterium]